MYLLSIIYEQRINTIIANVKTTTLINCHIIKVIDCYILHSVLLITITLLIAVSLCCYLIKYCARHLLLFYN